MKCEICGRGMVEGVNLHRQNEKGVNGVWRCDEHNILPIAPEVQLIIDGLKLHKKRTYLQ